MISQFSPAGWREDIAAVSILRIWLPPGCVDIDRSGGGRDLGCVVLSPATRGEYTQRK